MAKVMCVAHGYGQEILLVGNQIVGARRDTNYVYIMATSGVEYKIERSDMQGVDAAWQFAEDALQEI